MPHGYCLLGRQPILNRHEELVAYELLFRSADARDANVENHSQATASVIINTLVSFGIEEIIGKHKGFINLELELLMDDSLQLLPKKQVVIELLETLVYTPELVEQCRLLKESGFAIALDDHEYSHAYHELYEIVDIVKVDIMQNPPDRLSDVVKHLGKYSLQLLAEKVETYEDFKLCHDLGFDLFQGYHFAKPSVMKKKRVDDSVSTLLKLIRYLGEDADVAEIEEVFRSDPVLTYKLLLLANSVGIGCRSKIVSIRHAIAILGYQQIKRWVQLSLFACGNSDFLEHPLVDMAAVRAGFMETIADNLEALKAGRNYNEKAFLTGILSILDKIYDISMEEMVLKLGLSDDVTEALISREGELGRLLHLAELFEIMDCAHLNKHLSEMAISIDDVLLAQKRAFAWREAMT